MSTTTLNDSPAPQAPQPKQSAEPHRVGGDGFNRHSLDPKMLRDAVPDALKKLNPKTMAKNPVMFVVEVGSALTTYEAVTKPSVFAWVITVWLWLTVVFA